jgi:hypothetical protein
LLPSSNNQDIHMQKYFHVNTIKDNILVLDKISITLMFEYDLRYKKILRKMCSDLFGY